MEPFRVDVPDEVLNDLHARLKLTRWADDFANDGWQYGTNTAYLKELVAYWIDEYDWRKQERAINAYPQFRTEIDGVPLHFIHVRGKGPSPKPLILSHGWPWTFWEYRKVIDCRPARTAAMPRMRCTWWSRLCRATGSPHRCVSLASISGGLPGFG